MAQNGIMDDFQFRRAQAQYKRATDDVLGWLRAVTNTPKEGTAISYHKFLATNAKAAGIAMPQSTQTALDMAIQLRTRCKNHHIMLGSDDQRHNFILEVLEEISGIYELEPTSTTWGQAECYTTPAIAPAPPVQFTTPVFTQMPPSPPPSTYFPPTYNGSALPMPINTGHYNMHPQQTFMMHGTTFYPADPSMQHAMYIGPYQDPCNNITTQQVYEQTILQQTYRQFGYPANNAAAHLHAQAMPHYMPA